MTLRTALLASLATVAVACGGGKSTPPTNKPMPNTVDVAIASVTLADDCGTGPTTSFPAQTSRVAKPSPEFGDMDMGEAASMSQAKRACEQSSVQLRVVNGTKAASDISIKKIELVDESGTVLRELTPREPSKWTGDAYTAWDGKADAGQTLQVSYALSEPSVSAGGTYTVRVTVASAEGDKTLETKTTLEAPASLPPGAVT